MTQESTDIIDALDAQMVSASVYPASGVQRLVAVLLEPYGDERLLLPAMHSCTRPSNNLTKDCWPSWKLISSNTLTCWVIDLAWATLVCMPRYIYIHAHLYRDPASGALMKHLLLHTAQWMLRMQSALNPRQGHPLADDSDALSLMPMLARMAREQMPFYGTLRDASRSG